MDEGFPWPSTDAQKVDSMALAVVKALLVRGGMPAAQWSRLRRTVENEGATNWFNRHAGFQFVLEVVRLFDYSLDQALRTPTKSPLYDAWLEHRSTTDARCALVLRYWHRNVVILDWSDLHDRVEQLTSVIVFSTPGQTYGLISFPDFLRLYVPAGWFTPAGI